MKKRFQKLISFALVLVMLVTMLPMGVITATAEGEVSAELAAGLADIANTSEFVIKSVADWNAFAEVDNQFVGKTVKLGADIDAEGKTLPQLFKAGNARCTFDGQGYTIKNVGSASAPNTTSLLSHKSNLNVQNLTVENCRVSGTGNRGILVDWQNCWAKYTFKNIKIVGSFVTAENYAAAVIGYMTGNGGSYGVDFENILVSGCSITGNAGVGSLIGYTYLNANDYGSSAKNIEVVNTTITDNTAASCAAGLYGYFRMHTNASLTMEHCYVSAKIQTPNSSGWTGVGAGLAQTGNGSTNAVTIKNCLTNNTLPSIVQNPTIGYFALGNFTLSNLFTVENRTDKTVWAINGGNTVNGASGLQSAYNAYQPEIVSADSIATLVTRDENGFITRVGRPVSDTPERPEPTDDPSIPAETVINSVEDWNKVIEMNSLFTGKTVKLGADLDFEGAKLDVLFTKFAGTFDGQGYTIKNAEVSRFGDAALIALSLTGTVKNLKIENVNVVGTMKVGMIAASATNGVIAKVNASGSVSTEGMGSYAGGLVGYLDVTSASYAGINNVMTKINVTCASSTLIGGLAGQINVTSGCKAIIANTYIGGSINNQNTSENAGTGFVGKFAGTAGQDFALVKSVIVDVDMSMCTGNTLTIAGVHNGNLVTSELYSTTAANGGTWATGKVRWSFMSYNGTSTIDGRANPWAAGDPAGDASVMVISTSLVSMMIQKDEDGYLKSVQSVTPDDSVLPDYDTTNEYVINSVEDWKKLASSHQSFANKTIKLGADIDAKGETLPLLILNMTATNVIFDGCGYTIKNVGTAKNPNTTALIAYLLGAATIQNVNFENVHVSLSGATGIIAFSMKNDGTALVQNIKLVGCTVTSTANAAGGLVGSVTDTSATASTTFKNINIDKTSAITGNAATGGVIGSVVHTGTVNVTNVMTAATVMGTTETNAYDTSVGGLVGYSFSNGTSVFNISDCLVEGVLTTPGGKEKGVANLSGLIGASEGSFPAPIYEEGVFKGYEGGARTLNVDNVIITCEFYTATRWDSFLTVYKAIGYFNYKNVYTKTGVSGNAPKPLWQFIAVNSHTCVNGVITNGELQSKDDIFVMSPYLLKRLQKIDETTGFLTKIESMVEPYGYHAGEVKDGKYAVRFLGTAQMIEEQNVYVNVKATTASGVVKTFCVLSPLFERVTPFEDHGVSGEIVAQHVGAEKLLCVTVYDIPVGEAVTFEYWMSIKTPQGFEICSTETLTVQFDANGAPIVNQ